MSDYDEDEEGTVELVHVPASWSFSMMDIIGIGISGVGAVLQVTGQTVTMIAREFCASAAFGRQKKEIRAIQRAQERETEALRKMYEDASMPMPRPGDDS